MNLESLSETIDFGSPWRQMTFFKNSYMSSRAFVVVFIGTRCTCEVRQHTITQRQLESRLLGKGPMKTIAMDIHGASGMGNWCNNPGINWDVCLVVWQISH